jgi:acid phosphatase type 7
MKPTWDALYAADVEVVLNGHDHDYERFAPQDPSGVSDSARGIREFVVGTGGRSHYSFGTVKPNSEVRNSDTYGVLKLTLNSDNYAWEFVPEAGKSFTDSGSTNCH